MKKETTIEELRDWWLEEYYNTNSKEVVNNHPKEAKSPDWFKLYPVTQEQHDAWEKWAKERLRKEGVKSGWGFAYLDSAPYVENQKV